MHDTLRGLPLRFFKLRNFERFAIKEGIADEALKDVVAQMEAGQINANLGGDSKLDQKWHRITLLQTSFRQRAK